MDVADGKPARVAPQLVDRPVAALDDDDDIFIAGIDAADGGGGRGRGKGVARPCAYRAGSSSEGGGSVEDEAVVDESDAAAEESKAGESRDGTSSDASSSFSSDSDDGIFQWQ